MSKTMNELLKELSDGEMDTDDLRTLAENIGKIAKNIPAEAKNMIEDVWEENLQKEKDKERKDVESRHRKAKKALNPRVVEQNLIHIDSTADEIVLEKIPCKLTKSVRFRISQPEDHNNIYYRHRCGVGISLHAGQEGLIQTSWNEYFEKGSMHVGHIEDTTYKKAYEVEFKITPTFSVWLDLDTEDVELINE